MVRSRKSDVVSKRASPPFRRDGSLGGAIAVVAAAFSLLAGYAACAVAAPSSEASLPAAVDWPMHGLTAAEQRYSPLADINQSNAASLGLAWSYKLDVDRGTEATPIVVDGVMYVTSAFSIVSALDARTGKELWKYDPEVPRDYARRGCCDAVNRGVAMQDGRVYVGAYDGRLIALDAKSGKVVWTTDTVIDRTRNYTITGAPRIVKGKVIIGNGGAELGVRGYVSAYDAKDGRLAWRFFTVPGRPDRPQENAQLKKALKTWKGNAWWKFGGGGTVWDSMAYDPELDLLYIGTGNGSPWNRHIRSPGGGDNLYLSSILALKPESGEYVWHYQVTPGDSWDFTATQHIILADLVIGGKTRKVLMQAPKNGFFYVIDRVTGELLSADPYTRVTWASGVDMKTGRPIETKDADWTKSAKLLYPGPIGAHNWQPMSFSQRTGLVYIPMQEGPGYFDPVKSDVYSGPGTWHIGTKPPALPEDAKGIEAVRDSITGYLVAWDPVARKEVWRQPYVTMWNGGTLATAGGLLFQGSADGRFIAYADDSGKKLWETRANTGVMAAPITYSLDGEQYVAVAAGWGGGMVLAGGAALRSKVVADARVLVYKLGASGELPSPKPAIALPPPPPLTADAKTIERGREIFNLRCSWCHGANATGNNVLPDLRYLTPDKHAIFAGIVAGAYAQRGMPAMMDVLSVKDVEVVHQYVIKRAHDLRKEQGAE